MIDDNRRSVSVPPEEQISLDALRALTDSMPPSPERDRLQRLWTRRQGHHLDDLERREARVNSIERVGRIGFYTVLGCAIGAGLGVWPLNQVPSTWTSGATVIASAVYMAVIWWHHRWAVLVVTARASLGPRTCLGDP